MAPPSIVLLVRFKSPLTLEEAKEISESRLPQFRELTGLEQKYYLHDVNSGEYAGLYLWDSKEALDEFRQSELRATIASAYKVEGEPRVEVYGVTNVLRD